MFIKFKYLNDNIEKYYKFGKFGNILFCIYFFYVILLVFMVMIYWFIVIIIFGFRLFLKVLVLRIRKGISILEKLIF